MGVPHPLLLPVDSRDEETPPLVVCPLLAHQSAAVAPRPG